MQPSERIRRAQGVQRSVPICRRRHQDSARAGRGKRALEPLPFHPGAAVYEVRCLESGEQGNQAPGRNDCRECAKLLVTRGHFVDYLLERPDVAPVWSRFVNHPFVLAMGDGSLPLDSFKGYLIQDYLYLVCHFSLFFSPSPSLPLLLSLSFSPSPSLPPHLLHDSIPW